eukprot:COSAG02_NODE_8397_length_2585_cov_108.056718_1_plen_125_part_00
MPRFWWRGTGRKAGGEVAQHASTVRGRRSLFAECTQGTAFNKGSKYICIYPNPKGFSEGFTVAARIYLHIHMYYRFPKGRQRVHKHSCFQFLKSRNLSILIRHFTVPCTECTFFTPGEGLNRLT